MHAETGEGAVREHFGKHVGNIVFGWYSMQVELTVGDTFVKEFVLGVDMFEFGVESGISQYSDCPIVVTQQRRCSGLTEVKTREKVMKPNEFLEGI